MKNTKLYITILIVYEIIMVSVLGYWDDIYFEFDNVNAFVWLVFCIAIPVLIYLWRSEISKVFAIITKWYKTQSDTNTKKARIQEYVTECLEELYDTTNLEPSIISQIITDCTTACMEIYKDVIPTQQDIKKCLNSSSILSLTYGINKRNKSNSSQKLDKKTRDKKVYGWKQWE